MVKNIKLSLVAVLALSSSLSAMQNINVGELINKAKEFGAKVYELGKQKGVTQEGIKEAVKEATYTLPDRILGINIEVIRTGHIDITSETVQRIAQYIPETINMLNKVYSVANGFVQEPEGALMLFTTLNNVVQGSSIDVAIKEVANKAFNLINTNREKLPVIFAPIAQLVGNLKGMLEKLDVNNSEEFKQKLHEIINTEIASPEFNKIKDETIKQLGIFINNNGPAIKEFVEKTNILNYLTPDQLSKAFAAIKAQIQK
jgi:hypothetical protein